MSRTLAPQAKQTDLTPERRQCVREILDLMSGVGTGPGRERATAFRQKDRKRSEQKRSEQADGRRM